MNAQGTRTALLKDTLSVLKIPYHQAPGEAEAECAKLQQEGIVDAVWSEDGDTLMFGCDFLIRTHREGEKGAKSQTHVGVYRAEDVKEKSGLDQKGLILFAILNGGDYAGKLPGCGPGAALEAARSDLREDVHANMDPYELGAWRSKLQDFLSSARSSGTRNITVPPNFPDQKAVSNYCKPMVSSSAQLATLFNEPIHRWGRSIDETDLKRFAHEMFNIYGAAYEKHIEPIYFVRAMASDDRESNRRWDVHLVKTRQKDLDTPTLKVRFKSRNTQVHGGDTRVECETLKSLLHRGLPADVFETEHKGPRKQTATKREIPEALDTEEGRETSRPKKAKLSLDGKGQTPATERKRYSPKTTPSHGSDLRRSIAPHSGTVQEPYGVSSDDDHSLPDIDHRIASNRPPTQPIPYGFAAVSPSPTHPTRSSPFLTRPPGKWHFPSSDDDEDEDEDSAMDNSITPYQQHLRAQDDAALNAAIAASLHYPSAANPLSQGSAFGEDDADLKAAIAASLHEVKVGMPVMNGKGVGREIEVVDLCDV